MKIYEVGLYQKAIDRIAKTLPDKECRILITGASGLIGSCLVDSLIRADQQYGAHYQIYAMSRNAQRLENRFGYSDSVHPVPQDVTSPIEIDSLDYILHLASNADPKSYAQFPAETILTNVTGARSVLDYCRDHKTRALLTSSFEVYGKLEQDEYREEDFGLIDQNQMRSAYPESKRTAELLFRAYHQEYHTDGLIARLPSVYGPDIKESDNKAHTEFIRNAVRGEKIVLKSRGLQKRTYSYVMDIVSGLLFLLFNGAGGEAYNLSDHNSVISIAGLAEMIAKITGTQVIYEQQSEEEARKYSRPQNCILRSDKINSLGWRAKYTIEEGIQETLETAAVLAGKG